MDDVTAELGVVGHKPAPLPKTPLEHGAAIAELLSGSSAAVPDTAAGLRSLQIELASRGSSTSFEMARGDARLSIVLFDPVAFGRVVDLIALVGGLGLVGLWTRRAGQDQ